MNALTREPLLIRGAIGAVIAAVIHLLVVFGLPIPDATASGIATAVDAAVGLFVLLSARGVVTPVADPVVEPLTGPARLEDEDFRSDVVEDEVETDEVDEDGELVSKDAH